MEKRCANCKHFEPSQHDDGVGECRGGLPVIVPGEKFGQWPMVSETGYCGHFEPRVKRQ